MPKRGENTPLGETGTYQIGQGAEGIVVGLSVNVRVEQVTQRLDDFVGLLAGEGDLGVGLDSQTGDGVGGLDFALGGGLFTQMETQLQSSLADNPSSEVFVLGEGEDGSERDSMREKRQVQPGEEFHSILRLGLAHGDTGTNGSVCYQGAGPLLHVVLRILGMSLGDMMLGELKWPFK